MIYCGMKVTPKGNIPRYLTEGKQYTVTAASQLADGSFEVQNDLGFSTFCLLKGCAHLDGGSWEIIE